MSGRTVVMLALALVSGLCATFGVQKLLSRNRVASPLVEILVAARDLQVEEVLGPDLVAVKKVPKSQVAPGAFESYKQVEGRWVKLPMLAGEPIVDLKLAPKDAPLGLLARIPKGFRAFAVDVDEQTGVSGFVLPGHHVDVVLARDRTSSKGDAEAETILQNIQVLAAGSATAPPFGAEPGKNEAVRTVTLAVTPEQVRTLVAARAAGKLSLSLRGQNSHEIVELPPQPQDPPEPAAPAVKPPAVVVSNPEPAPVVEAKPDLSRRAMASRPAPRPLRIWHGQGSKRRQQANPEIHDPEAVDQVPGVPAGREVAAAAGGSDPMEPLGPAAETAALPPTWEVPPPWAASAMGITAGGVPAGFGGGAPVAEYVP